MNILKRWFLSSKEQDIDDSQNPWAGLASYEDPETAEHKLKFCGRDDDSYDLTRLIMGNVFVTLYGKSGIGKTSLLNAGVFPELREEQYAPVSIRLGMRDEEHPQSYQAMIIEAVKRVVKRAETINVIDEQQNQQSIDYLWNYFARHRFYDKDDEQITPVIVLDQFEEVFCGHRDEAETLLRQRYDEEGIKLNGHRDEAETLLRQLNYLNDKDHTLDSCEVDGQSYHYEQNCRFAVSIREDDLYRLEDSIDNCYLPALKRCRYRLRSLSPEGARDAILIPGKGLFDENEKKSIVTAIISKSSNDDGSISTNIISLLCSRIYVDFKKSGANHITLALVESFIKGKPFKRFYNEATKGFSDTEKSYIEDHFVDSASRRNSIPETDFLLNVKNGIELLEGKNRILQRVSTSSDGKNYRIELIHDSFCDPLREIRAERNLHRRRIAGIIASMLILFLATAISLLYIAPTRTVINKWSNPLIRYAAFNDSRIWTQEDVKNAGGIIGSTILQCDSDIITVENDVHLEKLIVNSSHPSFQALSNCPNLREISFTNHVQEVTANCWCGGLSDNITINIGDSVQSFKGQLFYDLKNIRINLSPNNNYFQLSTAMKESIGIKHDSIYVLWHRQTKEILYIQDVDRYQYKIKLPTELKGKLSYNGFMQIEDTSTIQAILSEQSAYAGTNLRSFIVPHADSIIGEYAFLGCKQLQSIELSNTHSIHSMAFAGCTSLESIDLSKVRILSPLVFQDCMNLSSVTFPKDSITIGASAFDGCNNLQEIEFPKVITIDPEATFRRCSNLQSVILPDSIIADDFYAPCFHNLPKMFSFCHELKNITFSENSHFNWREDSVLYYDDYPAILNCCTNPNWAAKDSAFYFDNGILYMRDKNEIYNDSIFKSKNRIFVDVFNGKREPNGIFPPMPLSSRSYFFFESRIGEMWPYLFLLSSKDTVIFANQFPLHMGTFTIVNRNANIKEIHLPYAEPKMVGLDFTQGTLKKENINLYVPFSHRKTYLQDPRFRDFKEIFEEDWKTTIFGIVKDDARLFFSILSETESATLPGISCWYPLLGTFLFMSLLFSLCYWMYTKSESKSSILEIAIISVISWYVFYWLSFHIFSNHVNVSTYLEAVALSSVCGLIMTILIVSISLFPQSAFGMISASKKRNDED